MWYVQCAPLYDLKSWHGVVCARHLGCEVYECHVLWIVYGVVCVCVLSDVYL